LEDGACPTFQRRRRRGEGTSHKRKREGLDEIGWKVGEGDKEELEKGGRRSRRRRDVAKTSDSLRDNQKWLISSVLKAILAVLLITIGLSSRSR
jgi:hypothetical protein